MKSFRATIALSTALRLDFELETSTLVVVSGKDIIKQRASLENYSGAKIINI